MILTCDTAVIPWLPIALVIGSKILLRVRLLEFHATNPVTDRQQRRI